MNLQSKKSPIYYISSTNFFLFNITISQIHEKTQINLQKSFAVYEWTFSLNIKWTVK